MLVTGSAGFIGSNFVREVLVSRPDWTIVSYDLLTYAGNIANLDGLDPARHELIRGDVADPIAVQKVFVDRGPFDAVVHFAAESHVDRSIADASEFVRTNVTGTQVLLSVARAEKLKRFLHISTDEVYGSTESGRFREISPIDPTSPYAASKAASDLLVMSYVKTHKLPAIITRCSNNYGPWQFPEKAIPLFVTNALQDKPLPVYGDGMNVREWLFVRDHCRALLAVLERGDDGAIYNIGSGHEMRNVDLARLILVKLGKPESLLTFVTDRPAHDKRYSVDSSRLRERLGWAPEVPFEQGITDTIAWYRVSEPWWRDILSGAYRSRVN